MTNLEKRNHLLSWSKSGLSKKSYCQSNGLNYSHFIYWFKSIGLSESSDSGSFIPINASVEKIDSLEISLPNGIRISGDFALSSSLLKMLVDV